MEPHIYEAAALSGWATNKNVPVEERLQAALQAILRYEARVTNLTEELEEASVRLMDMSSENDDLRDQVMQLQQENRGMKNRFVDNEDLRDQIVRLQSENRDMNRFMDRMPEPRYWEADR